MVTDTKKRPGPAPGPPITCVGIFKDTKRVLDIKRGKLSTTQYLRSIIGDSAERDDVYTALEAIRNDIAELRQELRPLFRRYSATIRKEYADLCRGICEDAGLDYEQEREAYDTWVNAYTEAHRSDADKMAEVDKQGPLLVELEPVDIPIDFMGWLSRIALGMSRPIFNSDSEAKNET